MSKVFNLSIFVLIVFLGSLLSSQVYAKTLNLSANETKLLTNNSLFTLNATCSIQGTSKNKKIKISVLKNNGTINGKNLSTGQATYVTVKSNSSISVSAESGTQINLTNLSDEGLQAVCST